MMNFRQPTKIIKFNTLYLWVFKFCIFSGEKKDRPIFFHDVQAYPIPIITPGTLYVSMLGNVTYTLPRMISVKMTVTKYFIGIPFQLPCFNNNIGSWWVRYHFKVQVWSKFDMHKITRIRKEMTDNLKSLVQENSDTR